MKKKLKDAYRVLVNFSETFEMMFLRDNSDYLLRIATLMKDRIDEILGDDDFYYDEEVSIIDSLAITREFLSYVKPEYETDFDNLITNGSFNIFDVDEEADRELYSDEAYFDHNFESGNFFFNIPATHTIEDVYILVHEYIHKTNAKVETSFDRDMLTESASILYEFLLFDWLVSMGISRNEAVNGVLYRLEDIYEKADLIIDYAKMSQYYDKHIDKFKISKLKLSEEDSEVEEWMDNFEDDIHYFFAGLIAIFVYFNYKKGKLGIKNIVSFSEKLNEHNDLESLDLLVGDLPEEEELYEMFDLLEEDLNKNRVRILEK